MKKATDKPFSDACVFAFHEGCRDCGCPCHAGTVADLEADKQKVVDAIEDQR